MNALDIAFAAETVRDSYLPPNERDTILAGFPEDKLRQGERYLDACRAIQYSALNTSDAVYWAAERYHISEPTMWRCWGYYNQKVEREETNAGAGPARAERLRRISLKRTSPTRRKPPLGPMAIAKGLNVGSHLFADVDTCQIASRGGLS